MVQLRRCLRPSGPTGFRLEGLPVQREHLTSIAVIGPNARVAQIMGGGSAQVNAHYAITPFEGIVAQVGDQVSVRYEEGCTATLTRCRTASSWHAGKRARHGCRVF